MKEKTTRNDIHGALLKEGDIVAEGTVGEEIWDGKGIIERRPLGIVFVYKDHGSTASLEPEETDCYNITQIRKGVVRLTDKADDWMRHNLAKNGLADLYISRYDGKFYAWDNIEIVCSVYDLSK